LTDLQGNVSKKIQSCFGGLLKGHTLRIIVAPYAAMTVAAPVNSGAIALIQQDCATPVSLAQLSDRPISACDNVRTFAII
jgi:hypothetical protein